MLENEKPSIKIVNPPPQREYEAIKSLKPTAPDKLPKVAPPPPPPGPEKK
jgi:hypothetical protein